MTYASNTDQKPIIEYKSAKALVTQHYSVAINPNVDGDDYMTGNQDNDSFSKVNGVWYALALGDGIETAINYNNPNIRYSTNQGGLILKSDNGFKGERSGDYWSVPQGIAFHHYMELDRTDPSILYINASKGEDDDGNPLPTGFYKIVDDGTQLTATNMDSGNKAYKFNTHSGLVLAISDNNIIRKIPTDGSAVTSINGGANIGNNVSIESIDFSASNNNLIYVSSKGYNAGNKVFKSIDGGVNFTNITNNLPDVIINKILYQQATGSTTLFVATNIGVYYTDDDGANWKKLGQGMPNVDVKDIEINYTAEKLVAATFGRGLWEVSISQAALNIEQTVANSLQVALYPNPLTNNNLKLSISNNLQNLSYEIYNVVGGIVKRGKLNTDKQINVNTLTNNVYLIRVFNNTYSTTKKFVLAK
ncbi:MAG: T9SS type A sorting domain-containing protein [Polaribacter sp.]